MNPEKFEVFVDVMYVFLSLTVTTCILVQKPVLCCIYLCCCMICGLCCAVYMYLYAFGHGLVRGTEVHR